MRKECTMTGPSCDKFQGRCESGEIFDCESVPSCVDVCRAVGGSDSAKERGVVETEQNRCSPVCCEKLRLTL